MSMETWLAFFFACWVISLSPGAGAVASMSAGLNYGFRHGYWNAIGLQLALLGQIAIVAAGLGALLAASEWAFALIKWLGVAYLLYLGWRQWHSPLAEIQPEQAEKIPASASVLILRGFLVNASNPKAIVFILAVLPQFLDPLQPLLGQYLLMTLTMIGVDLLVMAGYTGLAARVLRSLRSAAHQRLLNRSFGALFIAAACLLATVHRSG